MRWCAAVSCAASSAGEVGGEGTRHSDEERVDDESDGGICRVDTLACDNPGDGGTTNGCGGGGEAPGRVPSAAGEAAGAPLAAARIGPTLETATGCGGKAEIGADAARRTEGTKGCPSIPDAPHSPWPLARRWRLGAEPGTA